MTSKGANKKNRKQKEKLADAGTELETFDNKNARKKKKGKKKKKTSAVEVESEFFGGLDIGDMKEYYHSKWIDHPRAVRVPEDADVFSVIAGINPELVRVPKNSLQNLKRAIVARAPLIGLHVPFGHAALGTAYGNPQLIPEGYYVRAGFGHTFGTLVPLNSRVISNRGLTVLNLKENEVAIAVDETKTKVCYGPSQYVLLEPWKQAGEVVDLMQLSGAHYAFKYDSSVRALAFHVPKGQVALIQINDEEKALFSFGHGHHVVAQGGARFVEFIDVRDSEISKSFQVRTRNGNVVTWPVTLSLQIINPIAFHVSKRQSPLDVIEEAVEKSVAEFCASLSLNQIRKADVDGDSVFMSLAEAIMEDYNVQLLSKKHGVRVHNVVVGIYVLDKASQKIIESAAGEELKLQNDLRQAELRKEAAAAKFDVEKSELEIGKVRAERDSELKVIKLDRKLQLSKMKAQKDADIKQLTEQRRLEVSRMTAQEESKVELIRAEAYAQAELMKAEARAKAKIKEIEALSTACKALGQEFVLKKILAEINAEAAVETFKNTEKLILDPRLGAKGIYNFIGETPV
eukprot:TRINITY_DN587_c0_g1_i1.p1 TRINITY_DN587_c0_g1~~TRINITY_DN587_c0_g1_i1.p1  ORF type:complete len:573 (-),score=141.25 TRINITY_DN587_c0_g1_i1:4-1722(-)